MPTRKTDHPDRGAGRLTVTLFGSPCVMVGNHSVLGPQRERAMALLAYLAVEAGRAHARTRLAELLWPDEAETLAQQNLRQTLSRLRRAIGDAGADPPHLLTDGTEVQFNLASDCTVDVHAFVALVGATDGHPHRRLEACEACVARLGDALEMYRGPLLDGFHVDGCGVAFEEWVLLERERLGLMACDAMLVVANAHLARRQGTEARRLAHRLLAQEPWSEAAERSMMRALVLTEGRNSALRHYRAFCADLRRELGVEPEDATRDLEAQIRSGSVSDEMPHDIRGRIPLPCNVLVGRKAELARVSDYLAGRRERLVTLHGPGGVGKTRLALEIAERQAPLWRDGVWFVPLADVPGPDRLPVVVADALGLNLAGGAWDLDELLNQLRGREILLVLDGFEHLVPVSGGAPGAHGPPAPSATTRPTGTDFILRLVRVAPEMKVLVTSRARLGLAEEWVVDLDGLSAPNSLDLAAHQAAQHDAVQLFVQAARRGDPGFEVGADNVADVARICRLVDGLPLGIELAAAWRRLLTCGETADQIERRPHALGTVNAVLPERHRSLAATFQYSYNLLAPGERSTFRRLSVFRGGFGLGAAAAVAGADAGVLSALADHSLVRRLRSGRLDLHLALREFGAEKLAEDPAEASATALRHSRHYLEYLRDHAAGLAASDPRTAIAAIGDEADNVRAAWQAAAERRDITALSDAMAAMTDWYLLSGQLDEGERVFRQTADALAVELADALAGEGADALAVDAVTLGGTGVTETVDSRRLGTPSAQRKGEGAPSADSGAIASGDVPDAMRRAMMVRACGRLRASQADLAMRRGRHAEVLRAAREAVALASSVGDTWCAARGEFCQGVTLRQQGEYTRARAHLDRALALDRDTMATVGVAESGAYCVGTGGSGERGVGTAESGDHGVGTGGSGERGVGTAESGERGVGTGESGEHGVGTGVEGADVDRGSDRGVTAAVPGDPSRADRTSLERRCLNDLAAIAWSMGDLLASDGYLGEMRALAQRAGNVSDEAVALGNMGLVAVERGDYAVAMERYEASLELAYSVGRRSGAGHLNVGELYLEVGAFDDAERHLALALRIDREQGALKSEALTLTELGRLALCRDDFPQALRRCRQALAILGALDDPSAAAGARSGLAAGFEGSGRLEEAAEAFGTALRLRRQVGQGNLALEPLAGLARICLTSGSVPQALAHVEEILAHIATGTLDGIACRATVYLTCVRVLAAGRDARAADVLAAGRADLLARAARISDEGLRGSFLANVVPNRELASLRLDACLPDA